MSMNAISRAIECLGSQEQLAKAIDLTQAAISQYVTGNKRPSAEVAIRIEDVTEGLVRAEELRPDIPWHVIRGNRAA
jgi:DNA-binding transcriptional regulator YdaS (Cro superfamily)